MTYLHKTRQLLKVNEVAAKLGFSRKWLDQNRADLEKIGFPKPCLGQDEFGHARWDEVAIDLWLDSRMEPTLLNMRGTQPAFANQETSHLLKQRAESLSL